MADAAPNLFTPPTCVSALEARDQLRAALVSVRQQYGDYPAGTLGDAVIAAQELSVKFDDQVPWFHQIRDVKIPTYCQGDPSWQQLAGALFALSNELVYKPQYDAIPAQAAKEALHDVGDYFANLGKWGIGVGAVVAVVFVIWLWRK